MKNHTEILVTILSSVICTQAKVDALCDMYLHTEQDIHKQDMEKLKKAFNEFKLSRIRSITSDYQKIYPELFADIREFHESF